MFSANYTIELAKILKNESMIISVSSENSKSQLVILEYKNSNDESLLISKIKPLDIQMDNIKSLTVVDKFDKQNGNMTMVQYLNYNYNIKDRKSDLTLDNQKLIK